MGALFATDVAARGMDFDVHSVIQVGCPEDREQYVHRAGRTGPVPTQPTSRVTSQLVSRTTGVQWPLVPSVESTGRDHIEGVELGVSIASSSSYIFIIFILITTKVFDAEELDGLHLHREESIEETGH